MISLSFLRGGRNSTLSSEGSPHEALQLGKVVVVAATLVHHIKSMMVEVERAYVTDRL